MKYSIIVPVYNVECYIKRCIESILNQTYQNFEIIVVDDGSKDNSIEIVKAIKHTSNKILIVTKENGGLSDARNFGLKYATGDYVWFVDSDDYIRNDALEILNKNTKTNSDIISFGYYKVIGDKKIEVPIENKLLDPIKRYIINNPSACMKIYKRKLLVDNNLKFEIGKYYEDLGFTPSLIKYTKEINFIDDCLYFYVIRNNSIMTSQKFNAKKDDRLWAINKIYNDLDKSFKDEIEFLAIKHLIIMYSIDILKCDKKIYKPRVKKVKLFMKKNFNNYMKNKYFKSEKFYTKSFVLFYKYNLLWACKLIIRLGGY